MQKHLSGQDVCHVEQQVHSTVRRQRHSVLYKDKLTPMLIARSPPTTRPQSDYGIDTITTASQANGSSNNNTNNNCNGTSQETYSTIFDIEEFEPLAHIAYIFIFHFSLRIFLRVCGAEAEWALQKCGGGFEFAIKVIAYHSLSPSFSPLKSIIFLVSPLCHFRFMWMVNSCQIDQSKLRLVTV